MRVLFSIFLLTVNLCIMLNGTPRAFYKYSFLSENKDYLLVHYWSLENVSLVKLDEKDPFTDEKNHYSFFMLIDKKQGKIVFKKKSSLFTFGWIDPDSEFIILLSNIDISGRIPHIALFTIEGKLLFRTHFYTKESVLSQNEYNIFKQKYHQYNKKLLLNESISASSDLSKIYILPLYTEDEKLKTFLIEKSKRNHLSDCFSIWNNRLFIWYNQKIIPLDKLNIIAQPKIKLKKNNSGIIIGISLLDPCNKRFTIPITKKNKEGIQIPIK